LRHDAGALIDLTPLVMVIALPRFRRTLDHAVEAGAGLLQPAAAVIDVPQSMRLPADEVIA
jgi:hypothetical protein